MYVLNERTSLLYQIGSPFVTEHTWVFLFYISENIFLIYKNAPIRMHIIYCSGTDTEEKRKEEKSWHYLSSWF